MRELIFITIFSLMGGGDLLWWRWADNKLRRLRKGSSVPRMTLGAFSIGMMFYLVAVFLLPGATRRSGGPIPIVVHTAAFLWHLLVLPVLLVTSILAFSWRGLGTAIRLVRDLPNPNMARSDSWHGRLACAVLSTRDSARAGRQAGRPCHEIPTRSRRDLIGAAAVALPPLLMAGTTVAAMSQLSDLRVRRFELKFPGLRPALDGMTIAHVSDLHVGKFTRKRDLRQVVDVTNSLKCDFVAVTGDLIDLSLADLPRALTAIRKLDPRNGLFICEGNHDLIENRGEFERRMLASGLAFLLESEKTTELRGEKIQFLGTRWSHSDEELADSMSRVKPLIKDDVFPILLAHHPHAFDPAIRAGIPLTLSGHTHGGQIMLNEKLGFGPAMFRYWSGLYQKGDSSMVVSNGAGNWFPLRINAPAEIVHLTLRSL